MKYLAVISVLGLAFTGPAAARPVPRQALLDAVRQGSLSGADLADVVRINGAAFPLDSASEQELKAAGATPELLEAVRTSKPAPSRKAGPPLLPVEVLLKLYHSTPAAAAAAVKVRGAAFQLTPPVESQIRDAGAGKDLLALIALRYEQPVSAPVIVSSNAPAADKPIRVDAALQSKKLVKKVDPVYPHMAWRARISGKVAFELLIGRDGRVHRVRELSADPIFRDAALDAVRNYIYKPTLLDGQPVEVITETTVEFNPAKADLGLKN